MDAGFINMALSDAKEPTVAPEGEYELLIEKAEHYQSKHSGNYSVRCIIGFTEHPEFQNIFHYVSLPGSEDAADKVSIKLLMAKRFLTTFGIAHEEDGFNVEDFVGATGTMFVKAEVDNEDRESNSISLPKLDN